MSGGDKNSPLAPGLLSCHRVPTTSNTLYNLHIYRVYFSFLGSEECQHKDKCVCFDPG